MTRDNKEDSIDTNQKQIKNTETKKEQSINSNKDQEQKQENGKGEKRNYHKKKGKKVKKKKIALKKSKIYYQNIRGLKSKLDSQEETIDGYQPALVCIVETDLQKEEGYSLVHRNDRSTNSRGILIGVRDIKNRKKKT